MYNDRIEVFVPVKNEVRNKETADDARDWLSHYGRFLDWAWSWFRSNHPAPVIEELGWRFRLDNTITLREALRRMALIPVDNETYERFKDIAIKFIPTKELNEYVRSCQPERM